ncbi:hypothetical protein, partial [Helicobacter sp. T3_23-1059]
FSIANSSKVDIAKADSSKADIANAKSNNANFASAKSTHPQTPSAREGALRSVATLSREGASFWASSAREGAFKANVIPKNAKTTPKKRLAISLAASAIIAGIALDSLAAGCRSTGYRDEGGIGYWTTSACTGYTSLAEIQRQSLSNTDYWRDMTLTLSGSTDAGNVSYTLGQANFNGRAWWQSSEKFPNASTRRTLKFENFDAPNTSFTLTQQNSIATVSVSSSRLNSLELKSGTFQGLAITNGSLINSLTIGGTINATNAGTDRDTASISIRDGSLVNNLSITGTVSGNLQIGNRDVINSGFMTSFSGVNGKFTTADTNYIALLNASITIDGDAASWNGGSVAGQHILGGGNVIGIADNSITINAGENIQPNEIYEYKNIVKNAKAGNGSGEQGSFESRLGYRHLVASTGLQLKHVERDGKKGIVLVADVADSYGANVFRALTLSSLRRTVNTQNILDTMTTKTFHSDRYYNQEVELRLLQYDMSRLTNRSSKFAKNTRKNQKKLDKTREKIAKLTLEQSKGQNLDKGYNNFEVIDQLDAIFIPYTGRRDWRFFAVPYATHSYVDLGTSNANEFAGGALFGMQRNLRAAGIFGGFLGYEFVNTDTTLRGNIDTRIQNNSLQAGLNYFKTFSIPGKVMEGFIKASIRGGVDMPTFTAKTGAWELKLKSADKNAIPLIYNIGAEVKGGVTFYQFKRNSYVSPEVSLSYDMLASNNTRITKPEAYLANTKYRPLGADERYDAFYWHLPQLGVHVRYYKMYGNKFRTNFKAGVKYNMLNKQETNFRIGNLPDKGQITLPAVYGNLGFDLIWMIKKNHELSFGYDGLFYASTFAKENGQATSDWFNGVTTNLNFKYAYWFGGSDYVTDKDGNAVSRSIVEGGKKSKKSKKSKKKKEKKSKKKVYYIDG